jgi:Protein of unknown function (DUF2442)
MSNNLFREARENGLASAKTEPRAAKAWYEDGRIFIEFKDGTRLDFPVSQLQGLSSGTPAQLAAVEITPSGAGLHWEELDADLSVSNLVMGLFGSAVWMQELGRKGGSSTSDKKKAAAKTNGKLGGRPKHNIHKERL